MPSVKKKKVTSSENFLGEKEKVRHCHGKVIGKIREAEERNHGTEWAHVWDYFMYKHMM